MIQIVCILITFVFVYLIYNKLQETFDSPTSQTKGEKGDLGDQGPVGLPGDKGATGAKGPSGANLALETIGITFDSTKDQMSFPSGVCIGQECLSPVDVTNMKTFYGKCKYFLWDPPNQYRDYATITNNISDTANGKWKTQAGNGNYRLWSSGMLSSLYASHPAQDGTSLTTYWHSIRTEPRLSQRVIGTRINSDAADDPYYNTWKRYYRHLAIMYVPTDDYKNMLDAAKYIASLPANASGYVTINDKDGNPPDPKVYTSKAINDAIIYLKSLTSIAFQAEARRTYNAKGETPVEPLDDTLTNVAGRGKTYTGIWGSFEIFFPYVIECKYLICYNVPKDTQNIYRTPMNKSGLYLCV